MVSLKFNIILPGKRILRYLFLFPQKIKAENILFSAFYCTQSRDRTGMEVNPLVFETSASTNSAIWAFWINLLALVVGLFLKCVAKVQLFFKPASVWVKIFKYFFHSGNMYGIVSHRKIISLHL